MKNWKLLPYDNFTIESSMERDGILKSLHSNIEQTDNFFSGFKRNSLRNYEGYISDNGFKFRRILKSGINSFIPIVIGKFENQEDYRTIRITIRPNLYVLVLFSFFILFGLGMFFMTSNFKEKYNHDLQDLEKVIDDEVLKNKLDYLYHRPVKINWSALIFPLIAYLLATVFYNLELISVKQDLLYFLDAKTKYE